MTISADEAQGLLDKLSREQEIYVNLRELSKRQMEIIDADGDVEKLLEVLARKQVLINEIEDIERELVRFKKEWPDSRAALDGNIRALVEERVRQLRAVLAELMEIENQAQERLLNRSQAVAEDIRRVAKGRQAHRAYAEGHRPPAGPAVIDNEG